MAGGWLNGVKTEFTSEQAIDLKRCFDMFDVDHDGYLSTDDLLRVTDMMGLEFMSPGIYFIFLSNIIV